MLFGRTLRFTAKTRKQSQQHPWHCDCFHQAGKRLVTRLLSLEGCGKTIVARECFDGPPCGTTGEHSRGMLKKAVQQGRSERRGEGVRFGTLSF